METDIQQAAAEIDRFAQYVWLAASNKNDHYTKLIRNRMSKIKEILWNAARRDDYKLILRVNSLIVDFYLHLFRSPPGKIARRYGEKYG